MATALALLIVNLLSKEDFTKHMMITEKIYNIRNKAESIKLYSLYLYAIQNHKYMDLPDLNEFSTTGSIEEFFVYNLQTSVD